MPRSTVKNSPTNQDRPDHSEIVEGLIAPEGRFLAEIPLKHLDHSPRNVRRKYAVSEAMIASMATEQQVVITVIPIPDDYERTEEELEYRWWVIKGNRRLAAARAAKAPSMLCLIDLTKVDKPAEAYIDQVVENDDDFRRGLTVVERAEALFAAHKLGATKTEIRRRTGRSSAEVRAALVVGKMQEETKEFAQAIDYEWTLDELALLAEFETNTAALARIHQLIERNYSLNHAVELVRSELAAEAEHQQVLAALTEAGVTVTDTKPPGAVDLDVLAARVADFEDDPEAHRACSGHGAFFYSWRKTRPEFYCTIPHEHGLPASVSTTSASSTLRGTAGKPDDELPRGFVVKANRAWKAAAKVRQEWLVGFLARKSPPKPVAGFVTRMLHASPAALRDRLTSASNTSLYRKLGGPADLDSALERANPGRMTMLQLLVVAVAFEHQMSEASEQCKTTWRHDHRRTSPCSPADARIWLSFLVNEIGPELGAKQAYQPAPIERAVIDGVPYQGDSAPGQGALASQSADPDDDLEDQLGEEETFADPGAQGGEASELAAAVPDDEPPAFDQASPIPEPDEEPTAEDGEDTGEATTASPEPPAELDPARGALPHHSFDHEAIDRAA